MTFRRPEVSSVSAQCGEVRLGLGPAEDRSESISLILTALERGVMSFDTAEVYGPCPLQGARYPEHLQKLVGR